SVGLVIARFHHKNETVTSFRRRKVPGLQLVKKRGNKEDIIDSKRRKEAARMSCFEKYGDGDSRVDRSKVKVDLGQGAAGPTQPVAQPRLSAPTFNPVDQACYSNPIISPTAQASLLLLAVEGSGMLGSVVQR
ncbi:hypothetical protein U1Q18_025699, partial [Sarracenia purpurea var. burkii]